jgi:hypothetical protein
MSKSAKSGCDYSQQATPYSITSSAAGEQRQRSVSFGPAGARSSDLRIELRLFHTSHQFLAKRAPERTVTQGTPVNVCLSRWPILIFNISRRRISVLRDVCEESTFCCVSASARQLHRYCHALTLFLYSPRGSPRSHLSVRTMRIQRCADAQLECPKPMNCKT